jgi:hypothetical protein
LKPTVRAEPAEILRELKHGKVMFSELIKRNPEPEENPQTMKPKKQNRRPNTMTANWHAGEANNIPD